uniref:Uncharacterized protein n=1 Tax=Scylla olivacea TaxID=85551 RepID=A0A0N7ZD37_SCYOL
MTIIYISCKFWAECSCDDRQPESSVYCRSVNMADSASESDSSSVTDGPTMQPPSMPPSPITREQWQKRIDCLQQQNRVLRAELETYKLRVKSLHEENRALRQASVNIVSVPGWPALPGRWVSGGG